jgi:prepilin-type N-terminal cleavage/methylation domain-containing protein
MSTRVYRKGAGFTLLELLVVLALVAMIAVLVLPRFSARPQLTEPEVVGFLQAESAYAVNSGRANQVMLADGALVARDGEARYVFPEGSEITVHDPQADAYLPYRRLTTFYPDGTMTVADLLVRSPGNDFEIRLSPFSGIRSKRLFNRGKSGP